MSQAVRPDTLCYPPWESELNGLYEGNRQTDAHTIRAQQLRRRSQKSPISLEGDPNIATLALKLNIRGRHEVSNQPDLCQPGDRRLSRA
jgi:hypothetical protein